MKIMIIDDDEFTLKTMSLKLTKKGYEVVTACNADEALHSIPKQHPDLIIADVMMPYMSGLEFLNLLNFEYLEGIPVMMMSSLKNIEVVNLSLDLGAKDYIQKPVNYFELIPKINKLAN